MNLSTMTERAGIDMLKVASLRIPICVGVWLST